MSKSKALTVAGVVAIALAVLFTAIFTYAPQLLPVSSATSNVMGYETLFSHDSVMQVDISVDETSWQEMLESAQEETYISCDITINGVTYYNVGIRPKGNTSLSMVASSDSDRFSFKVKFDEYVDGQTLSGLDKLCLNNTYADATYMKEYLSYDLFSYLEVPSPLTCYASIAVNGETVGLYLAVEALEESFAQREYGSDYGMLYKVETMSEQGGGGMGDGTSPPQKPQGDMGEMPPSDTEIPQNAAGLASASPEILQGGESSSQTEVQEIAANTTEEKATSESLTTAREPATPTSQALTTAEDPATPTPQAQTTAGEQTTGRHQRPEGGGMGGMGGKTAAGGDLNYIDESPESYSDIFDGAAYKGDASSETRVISAIKNISEGTNIEQSVDVDQVLRYVAVNTVLVNLDSYFSNMIHNYYLYEENGKISLVPWDYNLAFGGFQANSASSAVNFPIDTPVSGISLSERPIVAKLLENEEYLALYHSYLSQIVTGYFNSGRFSEGISKADALIGSYVQSDPTAFYTYAQYQQGIKTLETFGLLRAQSIQEQLDGSIPSTTEGQSQSSQALLDASSITMSDMGQQGGSKGGQRGETAEIALQAPNDSTQATPSAGPNATQATTAGIDAAQATTPGTNATQTMTPGIDAAQANTPGTGANTPGNQPGLAPPGQTSGASSSAIVAILLLSGAAAACGLLFVTCFRRR